MKTKPELLLISFLLAPLSLSGCSGSGSAGDKAGNGNTENNIPVIDINRPSVTETATFSLG